MNGNKYTLDTNAILYILSGDEVLADLLYEEDLSISIITEIELLSYTKINPEERKTISRFLKEFEIVNISNSVKEQTIIIRQSYGLKLPDSIIAATAICSKVPLVTSDKQFKKVKELELLYYQK